MIFVDSNVFIYAVGRPHPLREEAQNFFIDSMKKAKRLVTSAEVLQELIHVYLPVNRLDSLDAALTLAVEGVEKVLTVDMEAVIHARNLISKHPSLSARDLIHIATCQLNNIKEIMSFDRKLNAAFK